MSPVSPSLGQQLQVTFRQLAPRYVVPEGWENQLKFEPGKELGVGISFGSISLDYQKIVRSREFTTGRRNQPYVRLLSRDAEGFRISGNLWQ